MFVLNLDSENLIPEEPIEDSTEEPTEDNEEDSTVEPTEETIEEPIEGPTEDIEEVPTEEPTEEPIEASDVPNTETFTESSGDSYYYYSVSGNVSDNYVTINDFATFQTTSIFLIACVFGALVFNAFMKKL